MIGEVLAPIPAEEFFDSLGSDSDRVNVTEVVDILKEAGSRPFTFDTLKVSAAAVEMGGLGHAIVLAVEGHPHFDQGPESASNIIDGFKDESVARLMRRFPPGAIEFWDYEPWQWPLTIRPESGSPILVGWSRTLVTPSAVLYPPTPQ